MRERERERGIEKKRYYSGLQIFFFKIQSIENDWGRRRERENH
jgi:hypothetical protein